MPLAPVSDAARSGVMCASLSDKDGYIAQGRGELWRYSLAGGRTMPHGWRRNHYAHVGDSDRSGHRTPVTWSAADGDSDGEISPEKADSDLESEEVPRQLDTAKSPPTAQEAGMVLSKDQGFVHPGEVMPFKGCAFIF